ncbi:Zn-ribbon domain-containing OB-fold protein [Jiangella asiatica]|uniref:Zn-ribbon domain-containing OB-fold protein n=1 Tax=Jiangella asiatica TaxID=2530372 RepID=A0A4R5CMW6_9ACTN|nr:OB-fold domain-containing protein [Jiangella asiatica]TDE00667.1 hypothetical protein E1269_24715 [Jiangella asiatica]
MSDGGFVRPVRTEVNRGFWEGVDDGVLRVQRCLGCGELRYPPASRCPRCLDAEWTWQPVSGRGEVLSYVVVHQRYHPAWSDRVPYNVVLVQLDEGPRLISNVLPLSGADLRVGMAVRVVFDDEDGVRVPRFVSTDGTDGATEPN